MFVLRRRLWRVKISLAYKNKGGVIPSHRQYFCIENRDSPPREYDRGFRRFRVNLHGVTILDIIPRNPNIRQPKNFQLLVKQPFS